jgi:predicted nucleotide-binding protein (sugar kinase/HSP70/actin superfamily)
MNNFDIVDVLIELNKELQLNPWLEFLIVIKLMLKKCRDNKRRLKIIDKNYQITDLSFAVDKLINLLEQSKKFIDSSIIKLSELDIKDTEFLNQFEKDGLIQITEIIDYLKKNKKNITSQQLNIIYNFMERLLTKYLPK